jgi:hypothetical protein
MGSLVVAGWIAQVAFWSLVAVGAIAGELRAWQVVTFVMLWTACVFGLAQLPAVAGFSTSCVAILDIALVFLIFRGDVRLT